ncbi:MAG TPA: hypothetical protein VKY19_28965 [Ktedonosporobacter sp.]|jgi:hypothetical protein|nr:hypothetical protein [Ktedonosporobacter sp.]
MMTMMLILCSNRQVRAIADEFEDWKAEGAGLEVRLYGTTAKAGDGFLLLAWSKPIPQKFFDKLRKDEDILDYVTVGASFVQPVPLS